MDFFGRRGVLAQTLKAEVAFSLSRFVLHFLSFLCALALVYFVVKYHGEFFGFIDHVVHKLPGASTPQNHKR